MSDTDTMSRGLPRRLMDKILGTALAVLGLLIIGAWGVVWARTSAAETVNVQQGEQINALKERLNGLDTKLDRQDAKLDRIFEKLK